MSIITAVHHDGATPRKTNRTRSMVLPSSGARQLLGNFQASIANHMLPHNNHHSARINNIVIAQRSIIQPPIIMIAAANNCSDEAAIDDEHTFVMHRKLLRRRHVRKVQKEQRLRRQREAESRKRRGIHSGSAAISTNEGIMPSVLIQPDDDSCVGRSRNTSNTTGTMGTATGQTVKRSRDSNGVLLEHNSNNNNNEASSGAKNAGSAFMSTPLLYSPLRSTKRRRLFDDSGRCC